MELFIPFMFFWTQFWSSLIDCYVNVFFAFQMPSYTGKKNLLYDVFHLRGHRRVVESAVDRFVSPKDPRLSGIGDKALVLFIWAPGDLRVFELPFGGQWSECSVLWPRAPWKGLRLGRSARPSTHWRICRSLCEDHKPTTCHPSVANEKYQSIVTWSQTFNRDQSGL